MFDMKSWRLRMGWTQREAASTLHMSLRHYQRLEARKNSNPKKWVLALCQYIEKANDGIKNGHSRPHG